MSAIGEHVDASVNAIPEGGWASQSHGQCPSYDGDEARPADVCSMSSQAFQKIVCWSILTVLSLHIPTA